MGSRRVIIQLALVLLLLLAFFYGMEKADFFQPLKRACQTDTVATGVLNYGAMGKILKALGYVDLVDNDGKRFIRTDHGDASAGEDLAVIPFQKKRKVDEYLYKVHPGGKRDRLQHFFPHGLTQKKNWPVLAIKLPPEHLYDRKTGIVANKDKQGRDWERKADVAFIKDGEVVFSSSVGLRVHGGKRRIVKPFQSYRLHFRKKYGSQSIPAGIVLDQPTPIRTLVVQMADWPERQPINNPLAYDISGKMGCIVPSAQLVEVYLNGVSEGMAYITEHLSRRQFDQYYSRKDYVFYKYRGQFTPQDERLFTRHFWVPATDKKTFSMQKVASSIDLDNFTRHVFSWVFSGTTDACQGVAVMDTAGADAKLRWINWDMDQSYWDRMSELYQVKRENWQQEGLELIYKRNNFCDRSVLFTRLIDESREYREYYGRVFSEILNHRLTEDFLLQRVRYYGEMLASFGDPHEDYVAMLGKFMHNRAEFLRREMVEQLGFVGPYTCQVQLPAGQRILIDGFDYSSPYSGRYFQGQRIDLEPAEEGRETFAYWLVDGQKISGLRLSHVIARDTHIEAVFHNN
jgi:hypothetical protein